MPGEYSRMTRRRTRDTSPRQGLEPIRSSDSAGRCTIGPTRLLLRMLSQHDEAAAAGMTQVNIQESPDFRPGFDHYYIKERSSSVNLPLVLTMALSPSMGGGPPKTLTTSPPASRRISQPAAMSQGLVPNSN